MTHKELVNTVVFDLDDTLYSELSFLKSAYRHIARKLCLDLDVESDDLYSQMFEWYKNGENVFKTLLTKYRLVDSNLESLVQEYRTHQPEIHPYPGVIELLEMMKDKGVVLGVITDGYSVTQRNKLSSLGVLEYFDKVVISEEFGSGKPDMRNYSHFHVDCGHGCYVYVGDNLTKDFISPNKLDWCTIALRDSGENIHTQNVEVPPVATPDYFVNCYQELKVLLDEILA